MSNKVRPFETAKHWKLNFDYEHLGSQHFPEMSPNNADLVVTIKSFHQEEIAGKDGKKWKNVVTFKETKINGFKVLPMILNITNLTLMESALESTFADDFIGKKVKLYVKKNVSSPQGKVNALRFRSTPPRAEAKKILKDSEIPLSVNYFLTAGHLNAIEEDYEISESQMEEINKQIEVAKKLKSEAKSQDEKLKN
jgi:hypothetical protein